jgi:DNA-binding NarL/FixJ family response regulator
VDVEHCYAVGAVHNPAYSEEEAKMSTPSRSRILIADDHTLVADLCRNLLEGEFEIVGTVSDGRAMVRAAAKLRPDVIVVDIAMPVLNGLDAGQQVKELLPAVKLIFLTMNTDIELAAEAFRRGAAAYLLKTCAAKEMVTAVREVLQGRSYMSQTICKDEVNYLRRKEKKLVEEDERLTERQREVLQLLAEGKVMKEIGGILNMTPRTVAFHKYRMMEALGARSNAELVRYAVRHHIVST